MQNILIKAFRNSYLAALLLISLSAAAQKPVYNPGWFEWDGVGSRNWLRPPSRDTTDLPSGKVDSVGTMVYWPAKNALWIKVRLTGLRWVQVASGGGGDLSAYFDSTESKLRFAPIGRLINTTAPLQGGGSLGSDITLSVDAANGTTSPGIITTGSQDIGGVKNFLSRPTRAGFGIYDQGNDPPGSVFNITATGANVLSELTTNTNGRVTWANTRILTAADIATWDSTAIKANLPIDTVPDIPALQAYVGKAKIIVVANPLTGGIFRKSAAGSANGITVYTCATGGFYYRQFNADQGISIDWSGADPTGATDASTAIRNTFALPYKKFVFNPAGRYRLDDSIRVANKDSLIVDFNGTTIYENVVHDRTIVFYGCNALTVKNANFDGAQTYSSWQAGTPTIFRSYLQLDSCTNAVVDGIRSKNKQGAVAFRKAYKFICNNVDHIGFLDATHLNNANYCPGIYIAHDGFDPVTKWDGYSRITNSHVRDNGSAILLGDDGQFYTISNIQGSNLYDNGIYLSSVLYVTVNGCIFRNAGSTGIKMRGRGGSITGNVITNSQVGIAFTGSSENGDPFFGPPINDLGSTGWGTVIANNVIDSVTAKGISAEMYNGTQLYPANDVKITGNTIMHHTGTGSAYALQVSTNYGAIVTDNTIWGASGTSAVFVNHKAGDSTQYVNFSNNTIHAATGIGVTFDGMKNSTVSGNKFFDVTGVCMSFLNCRGNNIINNTSPNGTIFSASGSNNNFDNFFALNRGAALTTSVSSNVVLYNWPNLQQGITGKPRLAAQTTVSGGLLYMAKDTTSTSDWTRLSTFYSLNGLTAATQTFATGTTGTDINISSTTSTHTFNVPTSSATNRGALSSADWSTFNGKAPGSGSANYVNVSPGSPQTGSFNLTGGGNLQSLVTKAGTAALGSTHFLMQTGGAGRWAGGLRNTESGSNTGSDYYWSGLADDGVTVLGTWLNISRANGYMSLNSNNFDARLFVNGTFKLTDGTQAAGAFLKSDANGLAKWTQDYVTPDDYGAAGDGVTNDATALQSAINSGRPVYIPAKTYLINTTVTVPEGATITGSRNNSILKSTANQVILQVQGNYVTIKNIKFLGDGKATGKTVQRGISMISNRSKNLIEGCIFSQLGGMGVYVNSIANYKGNMITNCVADSCNTGFMFDNQAEYTTVIGCYGYGNTYGIRNFGGNNSFTGGDFSQNDTALVMDQGTGNPGHSSVTGVGLNHNFGASIVIRNVDIGYTFNGAMVYDGKIIIANSIGIKFVGCDFSVDSIKVSGSTNVYFSNNRIRGVDPALVFDATSRVYWRDNYNEVTSNLAPETITITATTTLTQANKNIYCNNSSNISVNLPPAANCTGSIYNIKKVGNNANTIAIDPNGSENIEGSSTPLSLGTYLDGVSVQSNGAGWFVISRT